VNTTLTQDGKTVVLSNECPHIFEALYERLYYTEMAFAVSSYNAGTHSELAPSCIGDCTRSQAKISNVMWLQETSVNPAPGPDDEKFISEEASDYLSDCGEGCTECVKAWYTNSPEQVFGHCVSTDHFRYGSQCGKKKDRSSCSTEELEYCFSSYPVDSKTRWKDTESRCRSLPHFNRQTSDEFDWKFHKKNKRNNKGGLCRLTVKANPDQVCAQSWDPNEEKRQRGWTSMIRVRPEI